MKVVWQGPYSVGAIATNLNPFLGHIHLHLPPSHPVHCLTRCGKSLWFIATGIWLLAISRGGQAALSSRVTFATARKGNLTIGP